jgi:2'-5' RNA ligase
MVEEQPKSPRVRLFVALDLPDAVRQGIESWGVAALGDPALRPLSAHSLHITLAFLGHRPAEEVEPIATVVCESAAPAPSIELLDPIARPLRGRARVFALPARPPRTLPPALSKPFHGVRMTLYRSELQPSGAHYVPLAQVELSAGGRQ